MTEDVCPETGGEHDWQLAARCTIYKDPTEAECDCGWTFAHPDLDAVRKQAYAHMEEPH